MSYGSESAGNRTDWVLRITGSTMTENNVLRYTIVDGYLVAAPSRVLLDRAIEQRGNGYTLTRSKTFMDLLPRDGDVNVSALMWQNLGPALTPVMARLAGIFDDPQLRELNALASESKPSLVTLTAKDDRIILGSQGDPGFGSMLGSIVSVNQLGLVSEWLKDAEAHHGETTR
jgi:hypothetical protein